MSQTGRRAGLEAVEVVTPADLELMRQIRNVCAGSYSNDNTPITFEQQLAWWATMRDRVHAWLYRAHDSPLFVGYGLLRQIDDRRWWWNSLGVLPAFRGHGYGSAIVADLLERYDGPIYASVRRDNAPALAMHHPDEWQQIMGPDPSLIYLRTRGGMP